jgi:hypothetical protein
MSRHHVAAACLALGALRPAPVLAAHPLITEDTGTQGRGGWQLELTAEHGYDREQAVHTRTRAYNAVLSWGFADTVDVIVTVPWQREHVEALGKTQTHRGNADVGLDLKWRFYEQGLLSFAVKPGMTYPSGDADTGFGTGRKTYSLFFVTTVAPDPWAFHLHLGHTRNNNTLGERESIWHASLAASYQINQALRLVADVGGQTNRDPASRVEPRFAIAGFIASVNKDLDLDLDLGYKQGLTGPETDRTLLAGLAWRF